MRWAGTTLLAAALLAGAPAAAQGLSKPEKAIERTVDAAARSFREGRWTTI